MARHWPRLAEVASGRDNNLNLIRMVAALAVLVSHAWPLSLGAGAIQPLERLTGFQLGTQAVWVFFAISGFLIARSYERHGLVRDWAAARVLRIFPGLAVMLVLTALVLGPLLTAMPLRNYLAHPDTWSYVPVGLTLALRQEALPGVFEGLPYRPETNGSLWTLQYEVLCYGAVLLLGVTGAFRSRRALALAAVAFTVACLLVPALGDRLPGSVRTLMSLGLPFACGVTFHVARHRLPLNPWLLLPALLVLPLLGGTPLHQPAYVLALAYATFLLAYLPGGWLRRYNAVGDYSYGVYIYAWPVQQALVQILGPMPPLAHALLAFPAVLLLAALSWHLVEKPTLSLVPHADRPRPVAAVAPRPWLPSPDPAVRPAKPHAPPP